MTYINPMYREKVIKQSKSFIYTAGTKKKTKQKKPFSVRAEELIPSKRDMSYKQFLKTRYWRYVSRVVKNRSGNKCKKCGKSGNLNVHHTKYPIRFTEHANMRLLQCLCQRCHGVEHGLCLPIEAELEMIELDSRFRVLVG